MDPAPIRGFDPDDPEAWQVLADWLAERGDARGLLLALELSGRDPEQLEQLRRQHLHRYSEALWPVFGIHSEAELARHVELRWRAGLIVHARPLAPDSPPRAKLQAQLEGLLDSDAAVALAHLRGNLIDPHALVGALAKLGPRPSIRALTVGDYRTPMPALAPVGAKLPGLRELELLGPGIALDFLATDGPRLERLQLACELDPTPLRALLARPALSSLRALEIRLGGDDYFGDEHTNIAALLGPLLGGEATPALEHLAITGVAFGDRLVAALTHSPVLERLRSLDLSDSRFAPHAHSLARLDRPGLRLALRGSDLSLAQRERLREQFGERLD